MAKLKTLEDFFLEELKDIYSAERQVLKALPKMVKHATSDKLKSAFEKHLQETQGQIERLERIAKITGSTLSGRKCAAMEGILMEGKEVMEEDMSPEVRDVALIASAQKVEHYEIATYGCLKTYARLLDKDDIVDLLEETEDEEADTDETLNSIAEDINMEPEKKGSQRSHMEEENWQTETSKKGQRTGGRSSGGDINMGPSRKGQRMNRSNDEEENDMM